MLRAVAVLAILGLLVPVALAPRGASLALQGEGGEDGARPQLGVAADGDAGAVDIGAAAIAFGQGEYVYTGKAIEPSLSVTLDDVALVEGVDYRVTFTENVNAGAATATVVGMGSYAGEKTAAFTIARASLSKAKIAKIADKVYTGKAKKPKPSVKMGSLKLKRGRDYTLSYKSNRAIGKAKVVVKGKGNYKGRATATFKIVDWVSKLKVAKKTKQLIVAKVRGKRATVSLHVKSKGFWRPVFSTAKGWIGRNGLGKVREGSGHTPRG